MLEARLFTNVRWVWVGRQGSQRVRIWLDALWVESTREPRVIGFAAKNGRVDTYQPVFDVLLGCNPLEHAFRLHQAPAAPLPGADLAFKDGTRIELHVRDRRRPVDVLDATTGDARNQLWDMMSAKVAEYPVDMD